MLQKKKLGAIAAVLLASLIMCCGKTVAENPLQTPVVWKKGQLHIHTLWSDGRDFPESMLAAYKKHKFDFVVVTDHDVVGDHKDMYLQLAKNPGTWPPAATFDAYNRLKASCPASQIKTRRVAYRTFVRLTPYDELRRNWEIPGKFLVLPGEEITVFNVGDDCRQVHVNYANLTETILPEKGQNAAETLKKCSDKIAEAAAATPEKPVFFMANHPQWKLWDLRPEELLANPQYRHFELFNSGYGFQPPENVHTLEQFWDIINAFRLAGGQEIIYAVASDDSHFADPEKYGKAAGINAGWIYLGLDPGEKFSHDNIIRALNDGRFYPSTGVEFKSVKFDPETQILRVEVKPQANRKYKIRFNATCADFDRRTTVTTLVDPKKPQVKHETKIYSPEIGRKVLEAEGTVAECKMQSNWLYLRATAVSDEPLPVEKNVWHGDEPYKKAWTQPVVNRKLQKK